LTFFGLEYFYMYPDGFDIIEHGGLVSIQGCDVRLLRLWVARGCR
jgi:hypothetical protein